MTRLSSVLLVLGTCAPIHAQGTAPAQAAVTKVGVVTKIDMDAQQIVLKVDGGGDLTVELQKNTGFRRVEPGETDLRKATPIELAEIKAGDRVLARGKSSDDQKSVAATLLVVMSQSDIAKKQAAERADWDRRGVMGLVKASTPAQITIMVRGADGVAKPMAIVPAANAIIRRYAPDSVKFSDAKAGALGDIKPGDQVRARGAKSDDGSTLTADEIVSGSFRMLAGVVLSVDAAENQVRITNLDTKKPMVVKVNADSTMHKLAPQIATVLAARLHAGQPGAEGARGQSPEGARGQSPDGARGQSPDGAGRGQAAEGAGRGQGNGMGRGQGAGADDSGGAAGGGRGMGGGGRGGRAGDLQSVIDRSAAIAVADLKPGDAIIVSSTVGATADQVTAITVLAGVEPILTKPGTRDMALGDWNMQAGDLGGMGQ